jgi:hypothetical protein
MRLHLTEIAKAVAPWAHAILIVDGAGWHGAKSLHVPHNITLVKGKHRDGFCRRRPGTTIACFTP